MADSSPQPIAAKAANRIPLEKKQAMSRSRDMSPRVAVALFLLMPFQMLSAQELQLAVGGDVMLAELAGQTIARGGDPFEDVAAILQQADVKVANLECVVATTGIAEVKPYTFRVSPNVLPVVKRHFDVVCLANNHTGDFGHEAFLEQLALLKQHGIRFFGGGKDCVEARTPLMIESKGMRIALLGYNDFKPRSFEAGPSWPGVAWAVDAQIVADIKAARSLHKADLVIPVMHWGWEYEPTNDRQKKLARLMIESGADLVIGGHPHVTQEVEYHRGKLIVYSLGNFVFDGFDEGDRRTGWILRLKLDKKGLVAWDTVVTHMDEQGSAFLQREVSSPSGQRGSDKIESRRALMDSPLNR